MEDSGDSRRFFGENLIRAETMEPFFGTVDGIGGDFRQIPLANDDSRVPLFNLSVLHQKMDSLQQFLSESVDRNTLLGKGQMDMVSTEITSAIHQIIVNGAALLACSQSQNLGSQIGEGIVVMDEKGVDQEHLKASAKSLVSGTGNATVTDLIGSSVRTIYEFDGKAPVTVSSLVTAKTIEPVDLTVQMCYPIIENLTKSADLQGRKLIQSDFNTSMSYFNYKKLKEGGGPKYEELKDEIDDGGCEIVELDAVELLAEHIHFCEICGKGFKRDANLRMHMRAHGNQFKTPEALAKPDKCAESSRRTRFSCPFVGCNRNKSHKKFRPLKSVICVKNHFKRSHCPKMFSCNRCNKKSFSVVADLKSHLKHCGESKWRCSCGTTFSRKDKLFGHMALFEGHMPAFSEMDEKSMGAVLMEEDDEKEEETQIEGESVTDGLDQGFFDRLLEGLDAIDDDCLKDVFGSPGLGNVMKELYEI